jgi:hypothetical protein
VIQFTLVTSSAKKQPTAAVYSGVSLVCCLDAIFPLLDNIALANRRDWIVNCLYYNSNSKQRGCAGRLTFTRLKGRLEEGRGLISAFVEAAAYFRSRFSDRTPFGPSGPASAAPGARRAGSSGMKECSSRSLNAEHTADSLSAGDLELAGGTYTPPLRRTLNKQRGWSMSQLARSLNVRTGEDIRCGGGETGR